MRKEGQYDSEQDTRSKKESIDRYVADEATYNKSSIS